MYICRCVVLYFSFRVLWFERNGVQVKLFKKYLNFSHNIGPSSFSLFFGVHVTSFSSTCTIRSEDSGGRI